MNFEKFSHANKTPKPNTLLSKGVLQRKCDCGQQKTGGEECDECRKKKSVLQHRKSQNVTKSNNTSAAEPRTGTGQPLSGSLTQHFRPRLGSLVDHVRIHNDHSAANFASRQGAVAVTSGANIYFSRGAFQAGTTAGKNLIAHELAHVHQQHRPNGPRNGFRSTPGDPYEREADRFATTGHLTSTGLNENKNVGTAIQARVATEQIATVLRNAVEGPGTDEEAIFNALTARTLAEITDIQSAYALLANGETLESRLRSELSGNDLSKALSLLQGETSATETARQLWNAVRGWGTDEAAIWAAVAGRTTNQWNNIQTAYLDMTGNTLLADLRDDLNDSEWAYLQTLLPGATGGAVTGEDRTTVIANRLETAMAGLGTDENAIYAALTGRSDIELREIEARFKLLTGFDLAVKLRDELTDSEYARVQRLLHPITDPVRIARLLRNAVQGAGTDELEIQAILTGRSPVELTQIHTEYQTLYGESLRDRLNSELSGADQSATTTLARDGVLQPEDEIRLATEGVGTDEERLMAVFREINAAPNPAARLQTVIDAYAAKGYGDMLNDIRSDLNSSELNDALALLLGHTSIGTCSNNQTNTALKAIAQAASLAQNAVKKLDKDIAAGDLSDKVSNALRDNFNPGNAPAAVDIALASTIRPILNNTRADLLTRSSVTCSTPSPMPCAPERCSTALNCSSKRITLAWTCSMPSVVRLCSELFECKIDNKHVIMLHEFVHHNGVLDRPNAYKGQDGFSSLTPRGDSSATDSLDNADSYAHFAKQVS